MTKEDLEDITREKTLVDVYRNVIKRIPERRGYRVVTWMLFAAVLGAGLFSGVPGNELGKTAREWSSTVFQFAYSVLGILLAGFSIFSTISTSHLVKPLAEIKEDKTGLSYLKYIVGHFMAVFVSYTIFLALHAAGLVLGWVGGPVTQLAGWLGHIFAFDAFKVGASVAMAIVAAFFVHLIIVLQSFVFNTYHAFMFMVRANIEIPKDEKLLPEATTTSAAAAANVAEPRTMATSTTVGAKVPEFSAAATNTIAHAKITESAKTVDVRDHAEEEARADEESEALAEAEAEAAKAKVR
jgi:hypothetical protein